MHELAIGQAVVATAVKHAAGRRVTVVSMTTGALRQVVPESLSFYFEIVARDTVCEGARLVQTLVPARLRCRACGAAWEPELPAFRCPACGGADVEVVAGNELEVESIEVEEAECIARR
jgi:hydrogenase nickel incorporation protein HypA/HybF